MTRPIPRDWRLTTLDEVAAPIPYAVVDGPFGSNLKLTDYVDEGIPVLQGKNITNDAFQWFDVRFISQRKADELKRSSVRVGDILLVKIGSVGYSAVIRDLRGFDFAIIPANLAKITPNPKLIETEYLHKWLTSLEAKRYLEGAASKTAQPALSLEKIRALPVLLPPLAEQRRITETLDKADVLRAKRRAALAQLDVLTQSIFLDLFGDPAINPRKWPTAPMSSLVRSEDSINYGVVQPGDDHEGGVPLIRVGDLVKGQINHSEIKRIAPAIEENYKRSRLTGDEILVSCVGSIGAIALADHSVKGYNIARAVARIPLADPVRRTFVAAYLRTQFVQNYFTNELRTVSQPTLNIKQLSETLVIQPPVSLQDEFIRRSAAVERLRSSQDRSRAELDGLFDSVQHRAFRGEL